MVNKREKIKHFLSLNPRLNPDWATVGNTLHLSEPRTLSSLERGSSFLTFNIFIWKRSEKKKPLPLCHMQPRLLWWIPGGRHLAAPNQQTPSIAVASRLCR